MTSRIVLKGTIREDTSVLRAIMPITAMYKEIYHG